jgi:hypothetical protein
MEDEGHGRVRPALVMVAGLDPAGGTADINFGHE